MNKWDSRFLDLSKHVSQWSKDPSTKVGAVIADSENRIISLGYNGLARSVEDKEEIYNNRELKYKCIVHAEINAILFAERHRLQGATLYTYPFMPCGRCAPSIIQSGIGRVVSYNNAVSRWRESFELSKTQLEEANVELVLYEKIQTKTNN